MEEKDRGVPSLFIIPLTLFFVGLFLFIALLTGQRDLTILSILVLSMAAGARLWTRLSLSGIECHSRVDRRRLFPGEKVTLSVSIENSKFLPVGIQMEISVDDPLRSSPNDTILKDEGSLLWHQRCHFAWELTAQRRGFHHIGPFHVLAGDLFAFFLKAKKVEESHSIIVYPKLLPLKSFALPKHDFFGASRAKNPIQDPIYILGTKDYQHGQPAKYIHWKASAHHNRLQEKIFEPTGQEKVLIVFDVGQFSNLKAEEEFERALEIVASLSVRMDQQGYALGLTTNGIIAGEGQGTVPVARNPKQLPAILEVLARLKMEPKGNMMDILCRTLELSAGTSCIYFSYKEDETVAIVDEYFLHRRTPVLFFVYQPPFPSQKEGWKTRRKAYCMKELCL
jgi:uncharacterized protein (DUF58 family)